MALKLRVKAQNKLSIVAQYINGVVKYTIYYVISESSEDRPQTQNIEKKHAKNKIKLEVFMVI